jgi:uncharacterized membrane protein
MDSGTFLYLILASIMMYNSDSSTIRDHAALQDEGATVVLTWLFMQTMFALHYAHDFYNNCSRNREGGLEFPGHNPMPDYWDFVYFSFVIRTAAQTADINITSENFRRIVALHSVIIFFFNTTILALTVNVGASLL